VAYVWGGWGAWGGQLPRIRVLFVGCLNSAIGNPDLLDRGRLRSSSCFEEEGSSSEAVEIRVQSWS
jgi:hypothetical protein